MPKSTPKTNAATDALHAPVSGSGIAVKRNNARDPQTSNFLVCCFLVLSNNHIKNLSRCLFFRIRKAEKLFKKNNSGIIGNKLPKTDKDSSLESTKIEQTIGSEKNNEQQ